MLFALAIAVSTGCGRAENAPNGEEGEYVQVGEALYQVQLSRLLNPGQRPDDSLLAGQPTPNPDEQYMGVFMIIENQGDQPYTPPKDMKLIDTQGQEYLPLDAAKSGFGLNFDGPIAPGGKAPPPDSPAEGGVDAASLVLFKLKQSSATENLPLELEVPVPGGQSSHIGIDL